MGGAAKILDLTMLILGSMDELRRHGYLDGGMGTTARGLARYDQLMAAPWRPTKKEVENHLNFLIDSFAIEADEVVRDFWLILIWRWINGEFEEQKGPAAV